MRAWIWCGSCGLLGAAVGALGGVLCLWSLIIVPSEPHADLQSLGSWLAALGHVPEVDQLAPLFTDAAGLLGAALGLFLGWASRSA